MLRRFSNQAIWAAVLSVVALSLAPLATADEKLKVLIIDGQNNHSAWPQTTAMMKNDLEATGRFVVSVQRTQYTWQGGKRLEQFPLGDGKQYQDLSEPKADPDFKPKFADYDVVLSNFGWKAAAWPEETQVAFEAFVKSGGGLVVVHAADNSFGNWPEFNKMIGLGGWDGRNEKSGPYVYYNADGKVVRDTSAGGGGSHGPQHEYQIVTREPEHPIMRGVPKAWMHVKDELYQKLRGPAANMTILATAFADKKYSGTDRHEPVLMTIDYGKGRVFHSVMGHDANSVACAGFVTTLIRGTEWAATGDVTLTEIPSDFPKPFESSQRE